MSEVPRLTTRAVVEAETPALMAWARRQGWDVAVDLQELELRAETDHPVDGVGRLSLVGDLVGYRGVPPAWGFRDPATDGVGRSAWPATGPLPWGGSSIFHSQPVICAPFNRLAYAAHGGPHSDWSGPANWLAVTGVVSATTLAAMLGVIHLHLRYSPGRMA